MMIDDIRGKGGSSSRGTIRGGIRGARGDDEKVNGGRVIIGLYPRKKSGEMGRNNIHKSVPMHGVKGILHVKGGITKVWMGLEESRDLVG